MKTKFWKSLLISTLFIGANLFTIANSSPISTHIEYVCVGQDSFLISLKLTVNCANPSIPDSVQIHVQSSCSDSFDVYLGNKSWIPSFCTRSMCNGGDLLSVQEFTYSTIVGLNSTCNDWTLSYSDCCRDTSLNLIGTPNSYVETNVFMGVNNCNTSPVSTSIIGFARLNQLNSFNLGSVEPDGDILRYAFASPLSGKDTSVVFKSGYSANQPIQGITIDSLTGIIEFTPTSLGKYTQTI